jgi:hypothetical protein
MKKISIMMMLLSGTIVAVSQTTSSSVDFKNALRPALILPLAFDPKTAEKTILAELKETGYKPEKSGGFLNKKNKEEGYYKFSGVTLPESGNQKLDLYFKVDPMEGDGNNRSSITLLVSKGYENFVSTESDSATFVASQNFLNGFVQNTNVFNINEKLDEQKQSLASSEKKWTNLRDRQEQTRKKIIELQSELTALQEEEKMQQQEVEKLRSGLKDLEARRTSAQQ